MYPIASGSSSVAAARASCRSGIVGAAAGIGPVDEQAQAPKAILKFAGEADDADQRRAKVVRDDLDKALDLGVRVRQIGGAGFDALLQAGVQHAHFRSRAAKFARVAHDGDRGDADHDDDHDAADDREQPKQGCIRPLLGDTGGQAFIGGADDAGEEYIGFVHQRLAAIGSDPRERVRIPVIALQAMVRSISANFSLMTVVRRCSDALRPS